MSLALVFFLATSQAPTVETIQPKQIGTVVLPIVERPPTAIHDVENFFWTAENRLVVLRGGTQPTVVVTDARGKVERTIVIPAVPEDKEGRTEETGIRALAWCGGNRFLVFRSSRRRGVAWRLDAQTGRIVRLSKFQSPPVTDAAGAPDGTFAILASSWHPAIAGAVARFDAQGNWVWDRDTDGSRVKEKDRWQPRDIAIDPKGQVVALGSHFMERFDREGRPSRVKFPEDMGPSEIRFDSKGQTVLFDRTYEEPLITLNSAGRPTKWAPVSDSGGKEIQLLHGLSTDPKGRFWASDGDAIYRLGTEGKADLVIGNASLETGLGRLASLIVTEEGLVYAMGVDSGEVVVLEPDGRTRFVARPLPKDRPERNRYAFLMRAHSGELYIHGFKSEGLLKFTSDGARLGFVPHYTGEEQPLKVAPKADWRWSQHRLMDGVGRIIGVLNRWPDGTELDGPSAVAATGEILAVDREDERRKAPRRIAWFSSSGKSEGMTTLPAEVAKARCDGYDGRLAYFVTKDHVVALDRKAQPAWRFPLPNATSHWTVFPSRGGIALFDGVKTVTWYATPR
ncbi:MAG: hypothetical protein ACO1SV_05875 [Fimbriimonas sp.]